MFQVTFFTQETHCKLHGESVNALNQFIAADFGEDNYQLQIVRLRSKFRVEYFLILLDVHLHKLAVHFLAWHLGF